MSVKTQMSWKIAHVLLWNSQYGTHVNENFFKCLNEPTFAIGFAKGFFCIMYMGKGLLYLINLGCIQEEDKTLFLNNNGNGTDVVLN